VPLSAGDAEPVSTGWDSHTRAESLTQAYQLVNAAIGRRINRPGPRDVLEAGCGSMSHIDLLAEDRVVGIDISSRQLARHARLDERIVGDIQQYPLASEAFDIVVCWEVLEHLRQPHAALRNLADATRPEGVMILALPNVMSAKGLVTKLTPHRLHVWTYRHLLGFELAGIADHGPFPTPLPWILAPHRLERVARSLGLTPELIVVYESAMQQGLRRQRVLGSWWSLFALAVRFLSAGRISSQLTELVLVLRKPPAAAGASDR
jgi:SAM-dependent methyltransferase